MKSANKAYPGGPFDPAPQEMIDATMVEMPSVAGQTADTASSNIKTLGLNVKIVTKQVSSTQPANTVAYSNPKPGTSIPIGSVVKIYISKGGLTKVPSVKGMTPTDATKALNDAGFPTVSVPQPSQKQFFQRDPNVPAGNVIGTLPAAGKAVNSDSAILLIISTGP